jgi:Cu+-exporting ATPase
MGMLDKMRGSAPPGANTVTDPVCHMTIDPAKAAGKSHHGAVTFYFCSMGCKLKFDADPHKYLGAHSH